MSRKRRMQRVRTFTEPEPKPRNRPYEPRDFLYPIEEPSNIYFIQSENFVKIGIARDVIDRQQKLQVGNPKTLKLVSVFSSQTPLRHETDLHLMLGKYEVRGEWFELPQAVYDTIQMHSDIYCLLPAIGNLISGL